MATRLVGSNEKPPSDGQLTVLGPPSRVNKASATLCHPGVDIAAVGADAGRMTRQPRGDTPAWDVVLAHRPPDTRGVVGDRFTENGITPDGVKAILDDGGDALYAAAKSGEKDWADRFGGPLAVALLAAEVSAFAAHLNSRGSAVRALAVETLLDDFSAVTVAARLGVSRQKVYDISRGNFSNTFIDRVPWGQKL